MKVDAIVYGEVNDFLWATTEEIINYLGKQVLTSSGVHVSKLFIQNWDKNLKRNSQHEYYRNYIQVKWFNLFDDMVGIMCERQMVEPYSLANCVKHKKKNSVLK